MGDHLGPPRLKVAQMTAAEALVADHTIPVSVERRMGKQLQRRYFLSSLTPLQNVEEERLPLAPGRFYENPFDATVRGPLYEECCSKDQPITPSSACFPCAECGWIAVR